MINLCGSCVSFRRVGAGSLYGHCHIGEFETTRVSSEVACDVYVNCVNAKTPLLFGSGTEPRRRSRPRSRDKYRFRGDIA